MQYRFFYPTDEMLLEFCNAPTDGIALALRSTGYDVDKDEVLELAIVDTGGNTLFHEKVKPQNIETWEQSDATGGITPEDVAELTELYQFEQQISDLFENAQTVVGAHMPFLKAMVEQSWVTLPEFSAHDLVQDFCDTHCSVDHTNAAATVATLEGIAEYYGHTYDATSLPSIAACTVACYRSLLEECALKRDEKGEAYWTEREERKKREAELFSNANANAQMREKRLNQMNGLLWVAAAIIFVSVIIQIYQRGGDVGFMVVCGGFAVFAVTRAIANFRK